MKTTGSTYKAVRLLGLIAVALVFALGFPSCVYEDIADNELAEAEAGMMKIGFRVSAPASAAAVSRADGYEAGEGRESEIDFHSENYRIYFFDSETEVFIAEWKRVAEVHVLAGNDSWLYTFEGAVPAKLKDHGKSFKIMVLANWPLYPEYRGFDLEGKTITEVVTADWAIFDEFRTFDLVAEGRYIPFYGLMKCDSQEFAPGTSYDLGTVNLLRAVAKVEVNVTGLPDDIVVDGAPYIIGINPQGYCAPDCPYGSGDKWDTDYVDEIHLPGGVNHIDAIVHQSSMHQVGENNNQWIAYLPEYKNIGAGDYYSRIVLPLKYLDKSGSDKKNEKTVDFILNFAKYDEQGRPDNENARFDVRRNDLYRFNVTGDLHEIKFRLEVTPWVYGGRTEIEM